MARDYLSKHVKAAFENNIAEPPVGSQYACKKITLFVTLALGEVKRSPVADAVKLMSILILYSFNFFFTVLILSV